MFETKTEKLERQLAELATEQAGIKAERHTLERDLAAALQAEDADMSAAEQLQGRIDALTTQHTLREQRRKYILDQLPAARRRDAEPGIAKLRKTLTKHDADLDKGLASLRDAWATYTAARVQVAQVIEQRLETYLVLVEQVAAVGGDLEEAGPLASPETNHPAWHEFRNELAAEPQKFARLEMDHASALQAIQAQFSNSNAAVPENKPRGPAKPEAEALFAGGRPTGRGV